MNRKTYVLLWLLLAAGVFVYAQTAPAQDSIPANDATRFIGQQKTVCGTVASAKYASRSKGKPTFLNLDKPYPRQVFTVLIWGSDRGNFDTPPEALSGKDICVTGVIQSYKGQPEIIVKDPGQIRLK